MLPKAGKQRTHNPLVAGSSPACPNPSTYTPRLVFTRYASNAILHFYAFFTHSTATNRLKSQQQPTFIVSFHERFPIFCLEQREQREQKLLTPKLQMLTYGRHVPNPTGVIREHRELQRHPAFTKILYDLARFYQELIKVRNFCVISALKMLTSHYCWAFLPMLSRYCIGCSGFLPLLLVYYPSLWRLHGIY